MHNPYEILKENKTVRIAYFEHDFEFWYAYHSWNVIAPFQRKWFKALEGTNNILIEGFRASGKTTIVRWWVAWNIIYKKHDYIVVQSNEGGISAEWVRDVAKILCFKSLIEDHGSLYPFDFWKDKMAKAGQSSFETTNDVKIQSISLGETMRWLLKIDKKTKKTFRPSLLILDDIDVEKSVKTESIIDANERKVLGETIGALDPTRRRVIFLWNTINEDGLVPRFRKKFEGIWDIFRQPLIEDEVCVWPDVFTEDVIKKIQEDWDRAFAQNYLLIPFSGGDTIIKRESIKYVDKMPEGVKIKIGIDPAFSMKTWTDAMGFVMTGHQGKTKYVHTMVGFEGREKDEERFCNYVEHMYRLWKASMIHIEQNNGWEIIGRMLKNRGLAVIVEKSAKDKVTHLREFEGCFDRWEVFFLPGTEKGVEQLLSFPHGAKDDIVDAMCYSFHGWSGIVFASA